MTTIASVCALVLAAGGLVACGGVGEPGTRRDLGSDLAPQLVIPSDSGIDRDVPADVADGPPDAQADAEPDAERDAPSFVFPRAATLGSPVVAQPRVAVITFAGDPLEPNIADFNDTLRTSSYFGDVGAEYGVGPIGAVTHLRLTDSAPTAIDDAAIQTWLAGQLDGSGPLGAADPDTVYAVYYPAQTVVTYAGKTSCAAFNGYHRELAIDGVHVGYAVLPRCASADPDVTNLDRLTIAASHEYFEWATDPRPETAPAWHRVVPDSAAWGLAFANELADLCDGRTSHSKPADLGFSVQSMWSNRSSEAGHSPCQPAVAPIYATTIPTLPDQLTLAPALMTENSLPDDVPVPGVIVAPGQSVTITTRVYADAPTTTSWHLQAVEGAFSLPLANLTLAYDRSDALAGDEVNLTVTAPPDFAAATVVVLYTSPSLPAGTTVYSRWPMLVAPSGQP